MKISIIIPAYNEEKLLPRCIESILKAKSVAHTVETEIIVIDNGSTDNTAAVAQRYSEVKLVHESRKGVTRARQAGFEASTGDIIACVDADVYITPQWIEKVVKGFETNPRLVGYGGPAIYIDVPAYITYAWYGVIFTQYITGTINRVIFRSGDLLTGGDLAVRRSALEKIGGFDTSIEFYGDDADTSRRLSRVGVVRFDLRLWVRTSGRRIYHEGLLTMMYRYSLNALSAMITGKIATKGYIDVRG